MEMVLSQEADGVNVRMTCEVVGAMEALVNESQRMRRRASYEKAVEVTLHCRKRVQQRVKAGLTMRLASQRCHFCCDPLEAS